MESFLQAVDIYCERTGPEFWSETINAATNISFIIASILLLKRHQSAPKKHPSHLLLIMLMALIGLGSFSFHTFANKLTLLADVVPIMLFVFCYLWLALRTLMGLSKVQSFFYLLFFTAIAKLVGNIPEEYSFNGSVAYFPCLVALILIAITIIKTNPMAAKNVIIGAIFFTVSLTFRSADMLACPSFAIGTHYLWHLLNGVVLYVLTRTLILNDRSRSN
jgi:hypothetical protein